MLTTHATLAAKQSSKAALNIRGPSTSEKSLSGNLIIPKATPANDYERLKNLPLINGTQLIGDVSLEELGIDNLTESDAETITRETVDVMIATDTEIEEMLDEVFGTNEN